MAKFKGYGVNEAKNGTENSDHLRKYFAQGIEWGKTQVGAEGRPSSESDMSVEGESNPSRNRAASGSKKG